MPPALLALLEEPSFLSRLFTDFSYLAPFVVLLLCGIGLPLPEEVTLLGSGLLLHQGEVEFLPIVLVCSTAILLGDSVPFLLGRRYGARALENHWFRRRLHPRRFRRLRKRFEEHGGWATFTFRFFPGVRIPGYFVSGTMGMSYLRFLLLDALGVALTVPLSIYLGKLFADQIDRLKGHMHDLQLVLAFVVLSMVVILTIRSWRVAQARATRRRKAQEPAESKRLDTGDRADDDSMRPPP